MVQLDIYPIDLRRLLTGKAERPMLKKDTVLYQQPNCTSCCSSQENLKVPIFKLWKYIPWKDGTSRFVPEISTGMLRLYHPSLSCINNPPDGSGVALLSER